MARAFLDHGVPLDHVALVVQQVGKPRPLFAHDADRPMNPASVIKLVTTFAALELLGRDYRWKTEAYLGGALSNGVLKGDLILKGYGDPKITLEQWQAFIAKLRANGLERDRGRSRARPQLLRAADATIPAQFDGEPLKPYNVGPDALLVNFKSVRLMFAPDASGASVMVSSEPRLTEVALGPPPSISAADCGDWRSALGASFVESLGPGAGLVRRPLCRKLRRARLVGGAARPSALRARRSSRRRSATPGGGSPAASRSAECRAVRCRSRSSNRRRSTTSCATSTSFPTT